jgi:hypothetical protein
MAALRTTSSGRALTPLVSVSPNGTRLEIRGSGEDYLAVSLGRDLETLTFHGHEGPRGYESECNVRFDNHHAADTLLAIQTWIESLCDQNHTKALDNPPAVS